MNLRISAALILPRNDLKAYLCKPSKTASLLAEVFFLDFEMFFELCGLLKVHLNWRREKECLILGIVAEASLMYALASLYQELRSSHRLAHLLD